MNHRLLPAALCALALCLLAAAGGAGPAAGNRLASHLFLAVGKSRSIARLGTLLETIHLTRPLAVAVQGSTLRAVRGGIS